MSGPFDNAPLPWVAADGCLFDAMSLPVMRLTPASPASATEVANRVNAHDDLLAFARAYVASQDECVIDGETAPGLCECVVCSLNHEARAAIAKAEGRQP